MHDRYEHRGGEERLRKMLLELGVHVARKTGESRFGARCGRTRVLQPGFDESAKL
jgi:hypothetical protein